MRNKYVLHLKVENFVSHNALCFVSINLSRERWRAQNNSYVTVLLCAVLHRQEKSPFGNRDSTVLFSAHVALLSCNLVFERNKQKSPSVLKREMTGWGNNIHMCPGVMFSLLAIVALKKNIDLQTYLTWLFLIEFQSGKLRSDRDSGNDVMKAVPGAVAGKQPTYINTSCFSRAGFQSTC